jgi:hypothetical protein
MKKKLLNRKEMDDLVKDSSEKRKLWAEDWGSEEDEWKRKI